MANNVTAPSDPACHASAPSASTRARATWPRTRMRRGSKRSASTPPTRTRTACGNISTPSTAPASVDDNVCTAVHASATVHTASPNAEIVVPASQVSTIGSRRTGGGAAPRSGVEVALTVAPACWGTSAG